MKIKTKEQEEKTIDLNTLSREELMNIIISGHSFLSIPQPPFNKIQVCDFEVQSTTHDLFVCKQVIDNLIKKHKSFVTMRRAKVFSESYVG